jgi:hypothetical protein
MRYTNEKDNNILTSPGSTRYRDEGSRFFRPVRVQGKCRCREGTAGTKRPVDALLSANQAEFSPEKKSLVRYINKHSDDKYTAAPANSGVRRTRNQWMWRQAMAKTDGDADVAAVLIHDAATGFAKVTETYEVKLRKVREAVKLQKQVVKAALPGRAFSDLGRYHGQNKAIVGVFNGSVVYFNVRFGLTFLGRSCSTRQVLYFYLF